METVTLYIDDNCALCANSVRFLNMGIKPNFRVTVYSIQQATIYLPKKVSALQSVGLFCNGTWHVEWSAVRLCLRMKPGFWFKFLYLSSIITPLFLGNALYRLVSNRRMKLFGKLKTDTCLLPTAFFPLNRNSRIELSPEILT